MTQRIAYVVSPHGFGHAARSAAVLNAVHAIAPEVETHIFTTVPEWFWRDSLDGPFELHEILTDVGLVQLSPLEEDAAATLAKLDSIRPLAEKAAPLAEALERSGCSLAVCDISPLGLAAARRVGVPSVLVESFTWDWIYEPYFEAAPGLREVAAEMAELFEGADLRIQTEPVCRAASGAMLVSPVFRERRSGPDEVRRALGLDPAQRFVLITMGGTSWDAAGLDRVSASSDLTFVAFTGGSGVERRGNTIFLPERSPVFVPDLIAACEVVVGKLGYSTVAEAWAAGSRYLHVPRSRFPEGPFLAAFVREHLPSREIEPAALASGAWLEALPGLLAESRPTARSENGAARIAEELSKRLE